MEKTVFISIPVEDLQALIIDSVRTCLKYYQNEKSSQESHDEILNVKQASAFLKLAIPTIYSLTSSRILPYSKRGKKLYFSKTELTAWINLGRRATVTELREKARTYASTPAATMTK